jgi:hypothetical protein
MYFQRKKNTENKKKQEIRTVQLEGVKHFLIFAHSGKRFSENTKTFLVIF